MALVQKRYWKDPDRRMVALVADTHVFMPEQDIRALHPGNLDHWIAELRKGEADVRQLRRRLEALRDSAERTCQRPECSRPVTGRPDAKYCGASCRIRAHRAQQKAGNG